MNFFFGYSLLKSHVENKSGFQRNQHPFLTHIGDNSGMAGYQTVFLYIGNPPQLL
jgi:hypothetical protein